MKVRQVVTGHDANGRSVFVQDKQIDGTPIPGLGELAFLWNADEPATYPDAGENPQAEGIFAPVGGVRFLLTEYTPQSTVAPDLTPEMTAGEQPGMHTTDTTDFGILISGKLVLEVDDGAEVTLSPGDVVVQNGTAHRWRVVGDEPAVMAVCIVGAHRR